MADWKPVPIYSMIVGREVLLNPGPKRKPAVAPALYSMREAARTLRIDRATLAALARRGLIRVVPKGKRSAIPRSEIERLSRDGVPDVSGKAPRKLQKRRKGSGTHPDAIRKLDLDKLR